jgi:diadenosine tetraphosphate (Ap4A) HIT family hydrolase
MISADERAFRLDPRLAADSISLGRMGLCEVRLMDDRRWPWLLLVPMREGLSEWHQMDGADAQAAAGEIRIASAALKTASNCLKINVGALGNVVRQLHIHVVARNEGDPNWPRPVWGFGAREPHGENERKDWMVRIGREMAKSGVFVADPV